jgi:hypothetical protein
VLKVDRHKYVKLAYHGFRPMTADERKTIYNSNYQVGGQKDNMQPASWCCYRAGPEAA